MEPASADNLSLAPRTRLGTVAGCYRRRCGGGRTAVSVLACAVFLSACSGLSYALHLEAEGPEHEYEADDCPICQQLRTGWSAANEDAPAPPPFLGTVQTLACVIDQAPKTETCPTHDPRGPPPWSA